MVKFDVMQFPGQGNRVLIEVIDDAEGTPGSSRQYTRFKSEVLPELKKHFNNEEEPFSEKFEELLNKYQFTVADHKWHTENRVIINSYKIETKE